MRPCPSQPDRGASNEWPVKDACEVRALRARDRNASRPSLEIGRTRSWPETVIKLLQKHAWVINVGRDISVDEGALVEDLEKGEIGGAALDVFDKEPLPRRQSSLEGTELGYIPTHSRWQASGVGWADRGQLKKIPGGAGTKE